MAEEISFFAETNYRGKRVRFGIKQDDRRRHMYLIGKTGMGKTTMLEHMVYSDIANGNGLALVDPHGDFAEKILNYIPSSRINDVIYFNPADVEWPIAFNVMEYVDPKFMPLVASGLIGVFKKIWADSWGPRLEYVLRNAILALLEYPGSTLLGVPRMLIDKTYRAKVVKKITDPVVRSFWVDEFSRYPDKFQTEAISPIQNKIGQFLSSSMVRNIISQTKSSIDLRQVMDGKKILIINLSKGKIGEDYSALIGAMMITKLQLAAMGRVDIPESERSDFYLYVDEFQNFATESFANILSEARKYRLNLIIAHQYIGQLINGQNTVVRDAVFGNVGTIVSFRIGAADAEFLEKEFEPTFMMNDLVNLPKYNVYMKLMIDGMTSEAFSANTLRPLGAESMEENAEKIIKNSRQRYSTPRSIIEEKILRWSEASSVNVANGKDAGNNKAKKFTPSGDFGELNNFQKPRGAENISDRKNSGMPPDGAASSVKKEPLKNIAAGDNKTWYDAVCQKCFKPILVPFKPDPARKTYCRECLRGVRAVLQKDGAGETMKKYTKNIAEDRPEEKSPEKFISLAEVMSARPVNFSAKKEVSVEGTKKTVEKPDEAARAGGKISHSGTIKPREKAKFE
ncbi:MAG: type IV secretion system DNA-binding domain-containing protein [bacterium]|nr:type IV secretion system DNA-binding domain-containing protein [bacterium]